MRRKGVGSEEGKAWEDRSAGRTAELLLQGEHSRYEATAPPRREEGSLLRKAVAGQVREVGGDKAVSLRNCEGGRGALVQGGEEVLGKVAGAGALYRL